MAGHSKWKNIQHRKAGQDIRRGKIFTKLIREITTAAHLGGEDADSNPRLRAAIDNALDQNMTKDTITRAIKRGVGNDDDEHLEEIRYEGYGPNGVAVIVDCLTDNKNRTVADVRHAFSKCGGNLSTTGSVSYLFNLVGLIELAPDTKHNEDHIMEIAIEAGADDVTTHEDHSIDIITAVTHFPAVKAALAAAQYNILQAQITWLPTTEVTLDLEQAQQMLRLTEMLEDLDDVQKVYSNANIPTNIMNAL